MTKFERKNNNNREKQIRGILSLPKFKRRQGWKF